MITVASRPAAPAQKPSEPTQTKPDPDQGSLKNVSAPTKVATVDPPKVAPVADSPKVAPKVTDSPKPAGADPPKAAAKLPVSKPKQATIVTATKPVIANSTKPSANPTKPAVANPAKAASANPPKAASANPPKSASVSAAPLLKPKTPLNASEKGKLLRPGQGKSIPKPSPAPSIHSVKTSISKKPVAPIKTQKNGTAEPVAEEVDPRARNSSRGLRNPVAQERRQVQRASKETLAAATKEELPRLATKPEIANGAHFNLVKAFLKKWSLDTDCAVDIMRCTHSQRLYIISTFWADESDVKSIRQNFCRFAMQVQQKDAAGTLNIGFNSPLGQEAEVDEEHALEEQADVAEDFPAEEEEAQIGDEAPQTPLDEDEILDQFIEKWELDGMSVKMLQELPQEDREKVIETFAPRGDKNINGKFISFVRSRFLKNAATGPDAATDKLNGFIEYWGLNEEVLETLSNAPWELQENVIDNFNPARNPSRDVNEMFFRFFKTRQVRKPNQNYANVEEDAAIPESDRVQAFAFQHQLDDAATQALEALEPEWQDDIMEHFNPPPGLKNPSSRFMSFLKKRVQEANVGESVEDVQLESIEQFLNQWGLTDEAKAKLLSLPADKCAEIMTDFRPAIGMRKEDMTNKFINFANSRCQQTNGDAEIQEYVSHWGLNEEAANFLYSLTPSLAHEVMTAFSPKETPRDISSMFIGFAKSRQRTHEYADPYLDFIASWALNAEAVELLRSLPDSVAQEVVAAFSPKGDDSKDVSNLFMSFANSRLRTHTAIAVFQQTWGLDDHAIEQLTACPKDVQDQVMLEFNPKGDLNDASFINGKFIPFLRSRANNRYAEEVPWKRQRTY